MSKSKNKMEKCKQCENLDRKESNRNWLVCPVIPLHILAGDSADTCEKFTQLNYLKGEDDAH